NHTFTFSTFGDYTKLEGFIGGNGFGATPSSFLGKIETGGSNYAFRLNSSITPNWIGEFSFGLHLQRANTIPDASVADVPLITDSFAILKNGAIAPVVESNANFISGGTNFGPVAFISAPGGSLQRNFVRQGFGLLSEQNRNRWELSAKLSNIFGPH